jgi:hypothetical protein
MATRMRECLVVNRTFTDENMLYCGYMFVYDLAARIGEHSAPENGTPTIV